MVTVATSAHTSDKHKSKSVSLNHILYTPMLCYKIMNIFNLGQHSFVIIAQSLGAFTKQADEVLMPKNRTGQVQCCLLCHSWPFYTNTAIRFTLPSSSTSLYNSDLEGREGNSSSLA